MYIDELHKLYKHLIIGVAYWRPDYIQYKIKELKTLREKQTLWVGSLEHELRSNIDNFLDRGILK